MPSRSFIILCKYSSLYSSDFRVKLKQTEFDTNRFDCTYAVYLNNLVRILFMVTNFSKYISPHLSTVPPNTRGCPRLSRHYTYLYRPMLRSLYGIIWTSICERYFFREGVLLGFDISRQVKRRMKKGGWWAEEAGKTQSKTM